MSTNPEVNARVRKFQDFLHERRGGTTAALYRRMPPMAFRDIDAACEIAHVVDEWAMALPVMPASTVCAHLAGTFFEQYRCTEIVDIENYKMTLSYIG